MIESVVSLIGAMTMNAILLVGAAGAQVQEKSRNETVVTNPEARIADLERRLAAASKEVQELRQELDVKSKTVAIRLVCVDVSYAVEQLIMVAGNNPNTKIVLDKASNT